MENNPKTWKKSNEIFIKTFLPKTLLLQRFANIKPISYLASFKTLT
jgi:hypothetical protein